MEWAVIIILFIVAVAAVVLLTPGPPQPKPATLDDFNFPTAEPGRPIPITFGTVLCKAPNVVWYGDLSSLPVKAKSK